MTYYRLYFLAGNNGRIEHFREFEADDDLAAIRQAAEWRRTDPMELWSGSRRVRVWPWKSSGTQYAVQLFALSGESVRLRN